MLPKRPRPNLRAALRGGQTNQHDDCRLGKIAETSVPFRNVRVNQRFYIRPAKFIGITFVKVGEKLAEVYTWDEHGAKQSFELDMPVYPVIPDKD